MSLWAFLRAGWTWITITCFSRRLRALVDFICHLGASGIHVCMLLAIPFLQPKSAPKGTSSSSMRNASENYMSLGVATTTSSITGYRLALYALLALELDDIPPYSKLFDHLWIQHASTRCLNIGYQNIRYHLCLV